MAYFDLRVADELNVRVGRFTPAFGSFPLRHDPANHRTSDKPLPYDMGRMLQLPRVERGRPARAVGRQRRRARRRRTSSARSQLDYAAYAIGGPRGNADGYDFDYTLSRSRRALLRRQQLASPSVGARLALTSRLGDDRRSRSARRGMAGTYDPKAKLEFGIAGADGVLQVAACSCAPST